MARQENDDGLTARERQVVEMVADMFGGGATVNSQQEAMQADQKMKQSLVEGKDVSVSQSYMANRSQMAQNLNSVVMQEERMRQQQSRSEARRMQENAKARLRGETPKQQDRDRPEGYDLMMAQMAFADMMTGPEME